MTTHRAIQCFVAMALSVPCWECVPRSAIVASRRELEEFLTETHSRNYQYIVHISILTAYCVDAHGGNRDTSCMSTSLPSQRFAVLLRKYRRDRGLSQESLAERAGLHRNFISLIERGVNKPSIDSLFQLALALEISPIDLVREIGEMAD